MESFIAEVKIETVRLNGIERIQFRPCTSALGVWDCSSSYKFKVEFLDIVTANCASFICC